jgi:LmbE family N-acetylglucosaminyl deacetylase
LFAEELFVGTASRARRGFGIREQFVLVFSGRDPHRDHVRAAARALLAMLAMWVQSGQPDPVLRVVVRPCVVPLGVEQAAVLPHRR